MEDEAPGEDSKLFSISIEPEGKAKFGRILYNKEISILPNEAQEEAPSGPGKCWNCGGNHGLRDCKEKINPYEVNKRRKSFVAQKSRFGSMFKRYHLELEDIYSNATPGVISPKLRDALGLSPYQIPPYIYNMRTLGYPPGWLEDCKLGHSGINMLDSKGDRVPNRDEEEGEIFVEKANYDLSKIIDYPGYNVWPNADMLNETDRYRALPMCYEHSKEYFIEKLKEVMDTVEDGPVENPNPQKEPLDMDTEEMDDVAIETSNKKFAFIPAPPPEDPQSPPPPPPGDEEDKSNDEEEEEGEIQSAKKSKKRKLSKNDDNKSEDNFESTRTQNNSFETSHGKIKSIELGTPALKIHSPYSKLPSAESFQKDISDVEFFVNLPGATGKYEQLKTVLSSVRSKLNSIRESKS